MDSDLIQEVCVCAQKKEKTRKMGKMTLPQVQVRVGMKGKRVSPEWRQEGDFDQMETEGESSEGSRWRGEMRNV